MSAPATRRTVLRAAAWTVPAVTVVAAAPAHAASATGLRLTWVRYEGSGITVTVRNATSLPETVVLTTPLYPVPEIILSGASDFGGWDVRYVDQIFTAQTSIGAGGSMTLNLFWWPLEAGATTTALVTAVGSLSPAVVVGVPVPFAPA